MPTRSSSSKLSKTICQTSSNILQTHTSMTKTSPILSNRVHAYVQSRKLIESSNQTSSNILKQVHTRIRNTQSGWFRSRFDQKNQIESQSVSHSRFYQPELNKRKQTRARVIESNSRVRTFPSIDGVAAERIIADVWITKACQ